MTLVYEIPSTTPKTMEIGDWVEIFEAYVPDRNTGEIHVRRMRVEGEPQSFKRGKNYRKNPMHPHEGRVCSVDISPEGTRFSIKLRA